MSEFVAAHPKHELGVHSYDLAEFGLDRGDRRTVLRLQRPVRRVERLTVGTGGRGFVDCGALLVDLAEEPEAEEPRERVAQEEEATGDTDRQARDREAGVYEAESSTSTLLPGVAATLSEAR